MKVEYIFNHMYITKDGEHVPHYNYIFANRCDMVTY